MKLIASLVAAIGVMLIPGAIAPAQAAGCYYVAVNLEGRVLDVRGVGHAAKQKHACNRARRECNRRLERAYRNGRMPRGVVCKRSG